MRVVMLILLCGLRIGHRPLIVFGGPKYFYSSWAPNFIHTLIAGSSSSSSSSSTVATVKVRWAKLRSFKSCFFAMLHAKNY